MQKTGNKRIPSSVGGSEAENPERVVRYLVLSGMKKFGWESGWAGIARRRAE